MAKSKESPEKLLKFVENLKKQWLSTIDSLVDPLIIVDDNFHIIKTNKATASFGKYENIKSMIGKKCYELFAGRKSPCQGCHLQNTTRETNILNFEISRIRGMHTFEVSSRPYIDPEGNKIGYVHVYRDRTEAKALEQKLLQNEKLASIGLLAGGIAHEINNPLGGILVFSQMVLKEMPTDSPFYQDIYEIEAAAQRCKEIVTRLLDFARGQPNLNKPKVQKNINISDAIGTALRFARAHKNSKNIDVYDKSEHEQGFVLGERNIYIQLFLNIIQNAFQAMPDGGDLYITFDIESIDGNDYGIWKIKDSGIGIDEDNLSKIFDPFYTTKEPGEGTGLGLSISYGICKEAGGSLEVQSTINHGTEFAIRLPLCKKKIEYSGLDSI